MNNVTDQSQYTDFVVSIKAKIRHAKSSVVLSVNRQLIDLYFELGKEIVAKQKSLGWASQLLSKCQKICKLNLESEADIQVQTYGGCEIFMSLMKMM